MSILALNKVNYSYTNGKKILNNISMEFEKGKFYKPYQNRKKFQSSRSSSHRR